MKVTAGADRAHDQDRRNRAGNPVPLEKSRGRRQHGTDHECRHNRKEERLRDIENGDNADHQQREQSKGNNFRAADDRRQVDLLSGSGVPTASCERTFIGKDTQLALPRADGEYGSVPELRDEPGPAVNNPGAGKKFHRANVKAGPA